MLLCIFLLYYAQCLDGGRETDIGQALDDGSGQRFGCIARIDVAVIVRMQLTFGFQSRQYAVAQQFACLQVKCATAVHRRNNP